MTFLNESDLRRITKLAGLRPQVSEDDFDGDFDLPAIDPVEPTPDDIGDTIGLPDVPELPELPSMDMDAPVSPAPITPYVPAGTVPPATIKPTISPVQALLDQIESELPDVPVSEFKAVIDRIRSIAQNAEDVRRSLVMESAGDSGWADQVNREMVAVYGIDLNDAGIDDETLASYRDMAPKEFVSWWGDKHDLNAIGSGAYREAAKPKGIADYLREMDDEDMTIGKDRASAIKSIEQRTGSNPTDASKTFDNMKKNGLIKNQNGKMTMPAMGDDEFTAALNEEGDEHDGATSAISAENDTDEGVDNSALANALIEATGDEVLYVVSLVANDIEVTATTPESAEKYAKEDFREFLSNWEYELGEVAIADSGTQEGAETVDDLTSYRVDQTGGPEDARGEEEGTYQFMGTIDVPVMATSEDEATEKAKALLAKG